MPTFKDKNGQPWTLELNIGAVMRVRKESDGKFNLFDPSGDDLSGVLYRDLPEFWEVLCLLVEPEAQMRGMPVEQFGELMAGKELIDAQRLFFAEWTGFFHQLQQPENATVLEKLTAYQAVAMELVAERLKDPLLGKDLDDRVRKQMTTAMNDTFGNLRAKLESTLGG